MTQDTEDVAAARKGLLGIEMASVKHHQPSGGYDYFTVEFAGARIVFKAPFHDEGVDCIRGPLGPEMAELSSKAAACATAINDLLFDLAKRSARAALEASGRQSLSDRFDVLEGLAGDVRWQELAEGAPFTVIDRMMLRDMYAAARAALHQEGIAP